MHISSVNHLHKSVLMDAFFSRYRRITARLRSFRATFSLTHMSKFDETCLEVRKLDNSEREICSRNRGNEEKRTSYMVFTLQTSFFSPVFSHTHHKNLIPFYPYHSVFLKKTSRNCHIDNDVIHMCAPVHEPLQ